jgi:hypothetical protein
LRSGTLLSAAGQMKKEEEKKKKEEERKKKKKDRVPEAKQRDFVVMAVRDECWVLADEKNGTVVVEAWEVQG